ASPSQRSSAAWSAADQAPLSRRASQSAAAASTFSARSAKASLRRLRRLQVQVRVAEQGGGQLAHADGDLLFDRVLGDAQALGHLALGKALDLAQPHHLAPPLGQRLDGGEQA